ncbi:MAG: hypothetical protein AMXMBFR13_20780 [Phycisphaerae bacterium]
MRPVVKILAAVAVCCFQLPSPAEPIMVGGGAVRRVLGDASGRLHTQRIDNLVAGRTLRIAGPEFLLTWGQGQRATSDEFSLRELKIQDGRAVARLESTAIGLAAEIRYWPAENQPWLYKQIHLTNTGTAPFLLRTLEIEHLRVTDEAVTYAVKPDFPALDDWGQPVYTESLWFGAEFPATRSSATAGGTIFLRHHPGTEIAPGKSYISKRAALGAAKPGRVADAFMDYVATLTPRENPPVAGLYWNGFRVIKPPDRTSQGLAMVKTAEKLKALTGFTFDAWTYDAGFNMYRPDALFAPHEPEIWEKTAAALAPLKTPVGMWCSFSCIYDTPTHAWGKTQGYELQHEKSYCLAGPNYYRAIRSRLEGLVRKYRMGSINFDGMHIGQGFGCNVPGHGHLVGEGSEQGVFSTERVVENKLAIFHSLREINPDIILDLFICNEWASPWWLMELDGVHTVRGDTLGCDIPSPWLRDELITVRDIQVFDEHRRLRRQFPLWAEDLYGTQVRKDHLIDNVTVTGEAMAARWEDEHVMALPGRGAIANHILCSDLDVLDRSRGGLKFVGEVGNWVRRNQRLYRDFRLLGGEPALRQPYGYAHADGQGRVVVALRNPWIEPRQFRLAIDESIGLTPAPDDVFVNIVYPYRKTLAPAKFGSAVEIPLQDYAVLLLEVLTRPRQFEGVKPDRRWHVPEGGELVSYDESPMKVLPGGRLAVLRSTRVLRIEGDVVVPEEAEGGQVQLMIRSAKGKPAVPVVQVGGKPTEVAFHLRIRKDQIGDAWALIDVPRGRHRIEISLDGTDQTQLGAWLRGHYSLEATPMGAQMKNADSLFPVFAPQEDRRIAVLLAPGTYEPGDQSQ